MPFQNVFGKEEEVGKKEKKRKRCVLDFRERKHGRVKVPISISNECEAN
jgi:hypothetical protein